MVPQPGHGGPGLIIPRKRVGVAGVSWLAEKKLESRGRWNDTSMCKTTGARDFETSVSPCDNLDGACYASIGGFRTDVGLTVDEEAVRSGYAAKDNVDGFELDIDMMAMPPLDKTPVMRNLVGAGSGINYIKHHENLEPEGDEEEVDSLQEESHLVPQVEEEEPDIGFDELYNLLEPETIVTGVAVASHQIEDHDMAIHHSSSQEEPEMPSGGDNDHFSLLFPSSDLPSLQLDAESRVPETVDYGFTFLGSSAEEALQSGAESAARQSDDHSLLSLSSSAQGSLQGTRDFFYKQLDKEPFLVLASPDKDSWLSAPSGPHKGLQDLKNSFGSSGDMNAEKHALELVSLDASMRLGQVQSTLSGHIDHHRPSQNYGSVLASSTKFIGSIPALDGTGSAWPTISSRTDPKKVVSGARAIVDLTEDSDEDEDVVECPAPLDYRGVLGKRRMEDRMEFERKRRMDISGGASGLRRFGNAESKDMKIRSNSSGTDAWSKQFLENNELSQLWNLSRLSQHDISCTSQISFQDRPLSFSENMEGGKRFQFSKLQGETTSDRGSSEHSTTSYEMDIGRMLPPTFRGSSSTSFLCHGGQANTALPCSREERKALKAVLEQQEPVDHNKEESTLTPGLLSVPLLKHQRVALAWMEKQEKELGEPYGGILADDQGLGKTISTISLILKARAPLRKNSVEVCESSQLEAATVELDDDDDVLITEKPSESTENACRKEHDEVPLDVITMEKGKKTKAGKLKEEAKVGTSKRRLAAGTLVVCPTSVLRQWGHEIKEKVTPQADLSVLVYHGSNRTKDPEELVKYDVVLTTYSIVSMEVPKQPLPEDRDNDKRNPSDFDGPPPFRIAKPKKPKKATANGKKARGIGKGRLVEGENGSVDSGPLARVHWFRVVLDEAQSIKNARTQVARAAWGLRAKRRWCLSGTPIQNSVDDLYSYFRFLRYHPYDGYNEFRISIKDPVARTPIEGYKALQGYLGKVMLRRTKATIIDGKPIVELPQRIVSLKQTEFSDEERAFYTNLETESRKQFQDYAEAGTLQSNYVNILWMLLRLRQACDHPLLVKGHKTQGAQKIVMDSARSLPLEQRMQLLHELETNRKLCSICNDLPDESVVCICSHVFCRQCISEQLATGDDNCCPAPKCRKALNLSLVFTLASLKNCELGERSNSLSSVSVDGTQQDHCNSVEDSCWKTSSKIEAVINTLNALPKILVTVENGLLVTETNQDSKDVKHPDTSDEAQDEPAPADIVNPAEGKRDTSGIKVENEESVEKDMTNVTDTVTKDCMDHMEVVHESVRTDNITIKEKVTRVTVESTEKAIVFSQWTSMLDLLEVSLKQAKFNYRRLDGTMSVLARDRAVSEFKTLPEVTVIIMSLKAASLGLNMIAACHVLLLDVWWNPTTEDQAIDRAHRIGQTKTVNVSRFTVRNTIEDRILALQERKREIVASSFGEGGGGGQKSRLTVEDLEYLLQSGSHF